MPKITNSFPSTGLPESVTPPTDDSKTTQAASSIFQSLGEAGVKTASFTEIPTVMGTSSATDWASVGTAIHKIAKVGFRALGKVAHFIRSVVSSIFKRSSARPKRFTPKKDVPIAFLPQTTNPDKDNYNFLYQTLLETGIEKVQALKILSNFQQEPPSPPT